MGRTPIVLEHAYKHGLSKRDILHAWKNAHVEAPRQGDWAFERALVGPDSKGRSIQLIAAWDDRRGAWAIFHAMPLRRNMMQELGLER